MVSIFLEKAGELVDKMLEEAARKESIPMKDVEGKQSNQLEISGVSVLQWLVRSLFFNLSLCKLNLGDFYVGPRDDGRDGANESQPPGGSAPAVEQRRLSSVYVHGKRI